MSSLRALATVLLVSLAGKPVLAQDSLKWRDSVVRLGLAVRALAESLRTGDSTVVEVSRRHGMVVRASRSIQAAGDLALERFLEAKRHWFGTALPSEGGFRILLRFSGEYSTRRDEGRVPEVLELAGMPDSVEATRVLRGVSRRQIGNADSASSVLLFEFGKLMLAKSSVELQKWLRDPLPLSLSERERKLPVLYAFVTGAGGSQRKCVAGSLMDCAYVLGLRQMVGADLGGSYPEFLRGDLLLTALEAGGEGAWERLRLAATKPVTDQLTAAAALPIDSLLAQWRASLLVLRPTDHSLTAQQAIVTAFWAITLMAGAIGVSRWA
ncbi:MAG TPA: hypothetical protein VGQ69_10570 [Gemmatimonadales bacterium]|jgi:hypothetical protein|nr:hypothetical protein [Gemmatimonadales bacterium]